MKKAKKILALLLCAVLLIGASVAGTLAYLTDKEAVKNTFTVGNIDIELHEGGEKTRNDQTVGLDLHLVPNVPVDKKPVVTVLKDSEDCYVRVKVTVDLSANWTPEAAKLAKWMTDEQNFADAFRNWAERFAENYFVAGSVHGFNDTDWNLSGTKIVPDDKTITYTLCYKNVPNNNIVHKSTSNTELPAVFDKVEAPRTLTKDQLALLAGMEIKVEAHAIQTGGFVAGDGETAEQKAWAAFDTQYATP